VGDGALVLGSNPNQHDRFRPTADIRHTDPDGLVWPKTACPLIADWTREADIRTGLLHHLSH
jgi:hypothetical protein